MTTPPPPQGSSPNLPDRRYFVTENEHYEFESLDRPVTPYQTCASGEYKPTRTLRTWFVGEDGKTSIERERDALREKLKEATGLLKESAPFIGWTGRPEGLVERVDAFVEQQ